MKITEHAKPRCIIVAGAEISDYELLKQRHRLSADDFFIYCDSGLRHSADLGFAPNLIVGDFDSFALDKEKFSKTAAETPIIVLPAEKDDTDSMFAAKKALQLGFEKVLMVGAIGDRFDHSLANIGVLKMLDDAGISTEIADDYSIMSVVQAQKNAENTVSAAAVSSSFSYFSLLAVFGEAHGVSISGAKYPLTDANIYSSFPYAVSNEPLERGAKISIESGALLLIKVF